MVSQNETRSLHKADADTHLHRAFPLDVYWDDMGPNAQTNELWCWH